MNTIELGILASYFLKHKAEDHTIKEIADATHLSQAKVKTYLRLKGLKTKTE